jgi:hypothetical protein
MAELIRIRILYYELCQKEFRTRKNLKMFLKGKLDSEILRAEEIKKDYSEFLELKKFLLENKHEEDE